MGKLQPVQQLSAGGEFKLAINAPYTLAFLPKKTEKTCPRIFALKINCMHLKYILLIAFERALKYKSMIKQLFVMWTNWMGYKQHTLGCICCGELNDASLEILSKFSKVLLM